MLLRAAEWIAIGFNFFLILVVYMNLRRDIEILTADALHAVTGWRKRD